MDPNSFDPNRTAYDVNARMRQLDDRGERMTMYTQLPNGRCWDKDHLALVMDINETWAPFTVIRKLLIEAGARNVGQGILMSEREQQQWYDHCDALTGTKGPEALQRAKDEGSGIRPFTLRDL